MGNFVDSAGKLDDSELHKELYEAKQEALDGMNKFIGMIHYYGIDDSAYDDELFNLFHEVRDRLYELENLETKQEISEQQEEV